MDKPKEKKGKRKSNNKQPQHHPWDEVSLPGAGSNPSEQQPTILEVLNNKPASEEDAQHIADAVKATVAGAESIAHTTAAKLSEAVAAATGDVIEEGEGAAAAVTVAAATSKTASDDLVSSSHSITDTDNSSSSVSVDSQIPAHKAANEAAEASATATASTSEAIKGDAAPVAGIERQRSDQGHVLDIESHLIETYDEYPTPDDSVGIKELPPQQDELIVGPSKIETDANLRTVIEVEPAGAKPNRPIETLVQYSQALFIENEIDAQVELNKETELPPVPVEVSDEIRETAERLVNEIEQDVLSILRKCDKAQQEIAAERLAEAAADTEIAVLTAAVAAKAYETAAASAAKVVAAEAEIAATTAAVEANAQKTAAASAAKVAAAEHEIEETITAVAAKAKETAAASAGKLAAAQASVDETVNKVAEKAEETAAVSAHKLEAAEKEIESTTAAFASEEVAAEEAAQEIAAQIDEKTEPLTKLLDEFGESLSQQVDQQLSEVTSILKSSKYGPNNDVSLKLSGADGEDLNVDLDQQSPKELKIVNVPTPLTPLEKEERQRFIDSLPQIDSSAEAQQLADDCKREYYQSLKKYLLQSTTDKPPVPLKTYQWEDLRRAKERGGYPWTHLYKRPLGPDEEPEIVLLLRKSQELRFTSESPKSLKKVRIDDQVSVKEAERYIQELSETEEDQIQSATEDEDHHSLHSESISCVSDSVLATGRPRKSGRLEKIRKYLRRRRSGRTSDDAQSLPGTSIQSSRHHSEENLAHSNPQILINGKRSEHQEKECYPIMKKLKSMADRQKKRLNIRRIHLGKDEKIVLGEETKILKLKKSPKSDRSEIPHFIEKQDSDDVLEIVQLDESPSRKRRDDAMDDVVVEEQKPDSSIVVPDEIIEISNAAEKEEPIEVHEEPVVKAEQEVTAAPPKKAPRLRREHVYEEIEQDDAPEASAAPITGLPTKGNVFEMAAVEALKESLAKQQNSMLSEIEAGGKPLPLDRMGSSEEEQVAAAAAGGSEKSSGHLLAPLSSIDSTSSDDDRNRAHLEAVAEEGDEEEKVHIVQDTQETLDLKPAIKKEASPAPSDKKVTFSHVEDEAEPHREDIELPAEVQQAQAEQRKWKNLNDHEYEPIGAPIDDVTPTVAKEPSPAPMSQAQTSVAAEKSNLAMEIEVLREKMNEAENLQKDLEDRYFSSEATTPRTESRTDNEIHTSQVDSSALEELPLQRENRKKGFMASAQDRTRRMQAGFKTQAGKLKTKLRTPAKKSPSSSPKAKDRKRFKAPEFSKIKMPEIKRPDMSKLKDFKRPEFTKFNKPDMSKFKIPEKFSALKLRRSKSFKENETTPDEEMAVTPVEKGATTAEPQPQKKMFDFNFGTYPRAFRKKKKPLEPQASLGTETGTEGLSVIPSTETQPSVESSSSPQGDRGPGPVRSRWADKFSDVSYNDSEGSAYRRYGSEQESFDRESSLERRMKADLEETESEAQSLGIMGGVADTKQFAEFDEENRAIHEISKKRAGEFKRRPIVHQDSDLRSEDSKDVEGWTEKEIEKNKLLRKAELEAEASYLKYPSEERLAQETQSTASSGKKVVMEEIDDDEFFLRKRGISEDNIELRQYISNAIREGYDMPINSLERVGHGNEPIEYVDYDIPPPKPRRLHKTYRPQDDSQELESQRSEYGDELSLSHNGSDFMGAPKRPMRKGRSKYSMDSQDMPMTDEHAVHEQYFEDDEDYLRPPARNTYKDDGETSLNDLNFGAKQVFPEGMDEVNEAVPKPQPPRRRKRNLRDTSMEKDSYMNGFSGRSVSNSYLQPPEDVIVYRTEHEYPIPLATPERYTDGASADERKSRSASRFDEDDRTSRGADSLAMDNNNTKSQFDGDSEDTQEKFIIDMMENDGYAIVRKDHIPKPTPPARRKKFSRSPGERFSSTPSSRTKRSTPPPARPPPPRGYTPSAEEQPVPPRRKSATSLEPTPQNEEDDYEEPGALEQERPESPRNLQSGEVINKMKFRPLPPPPRPPREKRQRGDKFSPIVSEKYLSDTGDERIATSSTADSYDPTDVDLEEEGIRFPEVEVSTQTDPLPDDYVCEEFEITEDMKVIEPRAYNAATSKKTLDELLKEEEAKAAAEANERLLTEDEQLARGLQRFRDANQRSVSERSRASSQADRSKSQSRPPTPSSAVVIERRVSTPIPSQQNETLLEASLIVRPIDDLDLEEEALRREGLLTDSSQHSKSDAESRYQGEEEEGSKVVVSDYSRGPSSEELDAAIEELRGQGESAYESEGDKAEPRGQVESAYESEGEKVAEPVEEEEEMEPRIMRDFGFKDVQYEEEDEEVAREMKKEQEGSVVDGAKLTSEEKEVGVTSEEEEVAKPKTVAQLIAERAAKLQLSEERELRETSTEHSYEPQLSEEEREKPITKLNESATEDEAIFEEPPLPPPRRKSASAIEPSPSLTVMEQPSKEMTPVQSVVTAEPPAQAQFPARVGDLEVERLRVHALQAGQIMVSQLHGAQISADELECKSGSLVVKNIELPEGFIEDIVERVRQTERVPLLTVETQTSRQASSDTLSADEATAVKEVVPPPKPPRHRDLEAAKPPVTSEPTAIERLRNFDEQTQTEEPMPPPVYATTEYLQSMGPTAFYNQRYGEAPPPPPQQGEPSEEMLHKRHPHHHHHHHHHHHRRCSSSSSELEEPCDEGDESPERPRSRSRSHSRRSRSSTRPPAEPQTVLKAGSQLVSACSLSLANIINQLTAIVRGSTDGKEETRNRHIPTLVALFFVITFGLLLYLFSGKSIHTHHWDYFNPPSNEGRPT